MNYHGKTYLVNVARNCKIISKSWTILYGTTTSQLNSAADHNEAVNMTMYNVTDQLSKSLHGVVTIRVCYKFNADTLKVWQLYRTH